MGRGRQKAKDAKIARQLKYSNHGTDLRELERELTGTATTAPAKVVAATEEDDPYAKWVEDED